MIDQCVQNLATVLPLPVCLQPETAHPSPTVPTWVKNSSNLVFPTQLNCRDLRNQKDPGPIPSLSLCFQRCKFYTRTCSAMTLTLLGAHCASAGASSPAPTNPFGMQLPNGSCQPALPEPSVAFTNNARVLPRPSGDPLMVPIIPVFSHVPMTLLH